MTENNRGEIEYLKDELEERKLEGRPTKKLEEQIKELQKIYYKENHERLGYKKAKKLLRLKKVDLEHIQNAAIRKVLEIFSSRRVKENPHKDLGWLFWKNGEGIKVQTSKKFNRTLVVSGGGHPLIFMNFDTKQDYKRFIVKAAKLGDLTVSEDKTHGTLIRIGKIK